jgi:hypothetical protein
MTSIKLSNNNYAQLAKSVEVCLLGKEGISIFGYRPPLSIDSKYAYWRRAEDAQIRS